MTSQPVMGRYLLGSRTSTLRLLFKLRHLLLRVARRNYWHLAHGSKTTTKTTGLSLNVQSCRPPASYRKTLLKSSWLHRTDRSPTNSYKNLEVKHIQAIRFYSTSKRDSLKACRDLQTSSSSSSQPGGGICQDPETPFSQPGGVFQDPQTSTFHPGSLAARLGHSLDQLSRRLGVYFPRDDDASWVICMASGGGGGDHGLATAPEYLSRRGQSERQTARQRRLTEERQETNTRRLAEDSRQETEDKPDSSRPLSNSSSPPDQAYYSSGLQLFHISSLATRFGESFTYVSSHINSVFSGDPRKHLDEPPDEPPAAMATHTSQRRRRAPRRSNVLNSQPEPESRRFETGASPVTESPSSSSWEDSCQYLSGHINRYFGAKVTDEDDHQQPPRKESGGADPKAQKAFTTSRTPRVSSPPVSASQPRRRNPEEPGTTPGQQKEDPVGPTSSQGPAVSPQSAGLFHSSSYAARFGESYSQMAAHVNRYFKGRGGSLEEQWDGQWDLGGMVPAAAAATAAAAAGEKVKSVSFLDVLLRPSTSIPSLLAGLMGIQSSRSEQPDDTAEDPKTPNTKLTRRVAMGARQAELITRGLIDSVGEPCSPDDLTASIEALNHHILHYPACRALLWQDKTAVKLLHHRRRHKDEQEVQEVIRESLALIGYVDPVKGRGIRVLSIDGGGTRGVVPLQVLKLLEAETGRPIHQLFDYICGVSTGAVLGFMVGVNRFSLDRCAQMYRRFGSDVFRQNPLVGTVSMGWNHSYYSTETWEKILRETLGEKLLLSTIRDELSPKVSAVSAVVNWGTSPKPFVFRNYNHTPGSLSRYPGGSHYKMWEAVRASSAAPGYFQEFRLQSDIHQDGGILLNNPCALAVHEARLLWPNQPFQCVVSLGTGRYDNAKRSPATSTSLRAKLSTLVCSATDTEGVHTLLDDLLAPDVYFRFNPMLSSEVSLDESRPSALDGLLGDTGTYLERNRHKLARLCHVLRAERSAAQSTQDWVRERAWEMKQRWV